MPDRATCVHLCREEFCGISKTALHFQSMLYMKPSYADLQKENQSLKAEIGEMKEAIFNLTDELSRTNEVLEEMDSDINDSEKELELAQADIQIILAAMQENKFDMTFVKRLKTIEEQS
jgi:septal ring factor EnvC (AmiA/AmiB activator)